MWCCSHLKNHWRPELSCRVINVRQRQAVRFPSPNSYLVWFKRIEEARTFWLLDTDKLNLKTRFMISKTARQIPETAAEHSFHQKILSQEKVVSAFGTIFSSGLIFISAKSDMTHWLEQQKAFLGSVLPHRPGMRKQKISLQRKVKNVEENGNVRNNVDVKLQK